MKSSTTILAGEWKRTPLQIVGNNQVRPTLARVRITLFNWLDHLWSGQWHDKTCLDLFAGTGALGFEAASRGALQVDMWEHEPVIFQQLGVQKKKLNANQITIKQVDSLIQLKQAMQSADRSYDLIFCDPPFARANYENLLVTAPSWLKQQGLLYLECATDSPLEFSPQWQVVRQGHAGKVRYFLLTPSASST